MSRNASELPRVSRRLQRGFNRYLKYYFRKHFDAIRISKESARVTSPSGPLVVYANHPSWWDPILFMLLSEQLFPGRSPYGPMDAEALEKYGIFKRLGVFGIERGTHAGAVRFLRTAEAVLARDRSVLWLTAEGTFTDPRSRPVQLQFGLAHLVRRVAHLQVVPLAVEYPFWNERLPEVLVRLGDPISSQSLSVRDVKAINVVLKDRLEWSMDALAEEAASRDPDRFDRLLLGEAGVGGLYDRWRRWRASRRGEDLALSHEDRRR